MEECPNFLRNLGEKGKNWKRHFYEKSISMFAWGLTQPNGISYSNLVHRLSKSILFYGKKVEGDIDMPREILTINVFIILFHLLIRSFNYFIAPTDFNLCGMDLILSFFCVRFHSLLFFLLIKKDYCLKALRTFPYFLNPFSVAHMM